MFWNKLLLVLKFRSPYAVQKTPTLVIPAPYRVRGKLQPVSSDVALCYNCQSRWIPEPAPYPIRGQARNDDQRIPIPPCLEMLSRKLFWTGVIPYSLCLCFRDSSEYPVIDILEDPVSILHLSQSPLLHIP